MWRFREVAMRVAWVMPTWAITIAMVACVDETRPVRILAIGDSITAGQASGAGGPGFVDLMARELGSGFEVVNLGCGGANSWVLRPEAGMVTCVGRTENDDPVDYFDDLVDPTLPAEKAIVLIGTNDALLPASIWSYTVSVIEIIDGLLERGVGEILLLTPPPYAGDDPEVSAKSAALANAIFHPVGICARFERVRCPPNLHRLMDTAEHFADGDIHPNAAGHELIAETLIRALMRVESSNGPNEDAW